MEHASSYLALMPINKEQISTFADKLIAEVTSGEVDVLQVAVQFKAMEEVIATVRKDKRVQAEIIAIVERNKNKVEFAGATLEIRNRTTYHYDADGKWSEFEGRIKALRVEQKKREEFLKSLKEEVADAQTGEIFAPIKCDSEETLFVSFKK